MRSCGVFPGNNLNLLLAFSWECSRLQPVRGDFAAGFTTKLSRGT
jgi:hypothetical protein